MSTDGIARIFEGSTETGKTAPRSLTAKQIRTALSQTGYLDLLDPVNQAKYTQESAWDYPDWAGFVLGYAAPKEWRTFDVPTIRGLVEDHLSTNGSAKKMMGLGMKTIATALQMQRSGDVEPRIVLATIETAGKAILYGFEFLSGDKRIERYQVDKDVGTVIAKRIFSAGLQHNRI